MKINDLLYMKQKDIVKIIEDLLKDSDMSINKVDGKYITVNVNDITKPMLCVHLDTVNTDKYNLTSNDTVSKDSVITLSKNSKARCLGGDDRCGVFIALKLIKDMLDDRVNRNKYSFGFFYDEEIGGIGSTYYIKNQLEEDIEHNRHSCFIGLDRRNAVMGVPEVATYGYDNDDLTRLFKGYKEAYGSFTDASNLASYCDIACVNLSVGYNNEHTTKEYINISDMYYTYYTLRDVMFNNGIYTYITYDLFGNDDVPAYILNDGKVRCDLCNTHDKLYVVYDGYEKLKVCDQCRSFIQNTTARYA